MRLQVVSVHACLRIEIKIENEGQVMKTAILIFTNDNCIHLRYVTGFKLCIVDPKGSMNCVVRATLNCTF